MSLVIYRCKTMDRQAAPITCPEPKMLLPPKSGCTERRVKSGLEKFACHLLSLFFAC